MSEGYGAVGWNAFKRRYDLWIAIGALTYLGAFIAATVLTRPEGEPMAELQLLMRAFGSLALLMLTAILCIGPLARLSDRFKPLLYNRRHLGVSTFFVALVHAVLVLLWYHAFGVIDPLSSLFLSNPRYDSIAGFPFESLGVLALGVLFLMAATSHDFWNANLGPALWKALHMGVYVAYVALVAHVALGVIQFEKHPLYAGSLGVSVLVVVALHLVSGLASTHGKAAAGRDRWIDAGPALAIPDTRAIILTPPQGERIAVFRDGNRVMAISNVCRHQGGPLGEGRLLDGCVTCPWHGFQYDPTNGRSPPPFNERVATYRTRLQDGHVWVDPQGEAPGTAVPPCILPTDATRAGESPA